MLEISKQRHIIWIFLYSIQRVLSFICPRSQALTFVKFTRVVSSRLASGVEGAIVRGALSGEIDAPASEFAEATSIEAWEACRAGDLCFGTDSGMGIVETAEFEQFLEELPAADEVTDDDGNAGFADVPQLVGRSFRGSEVVVSV
jgi:hypothetical protein